LKIEDLWNAIDLKFYKACLTGAIPSFCQKFALIPAFAGMTDHTTQFLQLIY